ncbi:Carboxylesterase [Bisporella sp. PMI_857]|nr:Carboxylesterase [Bisporella sp. PMI_857]
MGILLALTPGPHNLPIPFIEAPKPKVTLRQGSYTGTYVTGQYPQTLEEFRGVPYGLSTAGERRFAAPLPITKASKEVFDASNFGYHCLFGPEDPPADRQQDEDCLNANICRPSKRPDKKLLPVVVDFYGGAFNFGMGQYALMNNLVGWSSEPLIGVTFNYRVGALGFLSSPLGQKEGVLNAGLKDQRLLLEWVRDNIAAFGGNPEDVTVMGNSAGAHGVGHHVMQNTKENTLFHKAIIESGGTTARAVYTPTNPMHEQQFQEFLNVLGIENGTSKEQLSALRSLPASRIRDASQIIFQKHSPTVRWPWQPAIDGPGGIIPQRPIDSLRTGNWLKIPLLTGFNTNEGGMFVPSEAATSENFTSFFHTLLPGLNEEDLAALNHAYPDPLIYPDSKFKEDRTWYTHPLTGITIGPQFRRVEQAYGHFAYLAPVKQQLHYSVEGSATAYLYHFAVNTSIKGGADHGDHVAYPTYDGNIRALSKTIDTIAGSMHAYWTSFITTGDPNKIRGLKFRDRPEWPAYAKVDGKMAVFGMGNDERAGGASKGLAVGVEVDTWMEEEVKYWWARTEKFEL